MPFPSSRPQLVYSRHVSLLTVVASSCIQTTSALTIATAVSRIIISFFPIGMIATFRIGRFNRLVSEIKKPQASPEAEEFWKMWCENEDKFIRVNKEDAAKILKEGTLREEPAEGVDLPDGRTAWFVPLRPGGKFGHDPKQIIRELNRLGDTDLRGRDERHALHVVRRSCFFMSDLPAAAVPYYEQLPPTDQLQLQALRRYWVSLKAFREFLKRSRWLISILVGLPLLLLSAVYLGGLERTPFTGRWRIILLTPDEENTISSSLAGDNWYRSIINFLTTPEAPAPPVLPLEDWRWQWTRSVLHRLETGARADIDRALHPDQASLSSFTSTVPIPPLKPSQRPRPRAASRLHAALPGSDPTSGQEHLDIGFPLSLLLLQKEEDNAFSYGFGGKGASGIVVYTGLLDGIMRQHPPPIPQLEAPSRPSPPPSGISGLFSGLFGPTTPARHLTVPQPTEEQSLALACVLAHEMGHLLLSHPLEILSQQQFLWPSILGLTMDVTRAFIWPITFLLGPAVNDALANVGRTTSEELSERYGHMGFQWKHEYEADLAAFRLLATAGYDPREIIEPFARTVTGLHEILPMSDKDQSWTGSFFKLWSRTTHPTPDQRVAALRKELERWEREAALA